MKTAIAALVLLATQASALPSSLDLTCRQVAELVNNRGAVVLSTGPGLYDRFVRDGSFCEVGLVPAPAWIPTRDSSLCLVGNTCVPVNGGGGR